MSITDNQRELTGRDSFGRFSVGNPGRPFGAKGKFSRDILERVKLMGDVAIQKLWEAVNGGERWAIELILSKALPASRTIEFEGVTPQDIKAALVSGDITPDEAKAIASAITKISQMEMIERFTQQPRM